MNYATKRDNVRRVLTEGGPAPTQNDVLRQLVYEEITDFLEAHWADLCNIRLESTAADIAENIDRGEDALVDSWVSR